LVKRSTCDFGNETSSVNEAHNQSFNHAHFRELFENEMKVGLELMVFNATFTNISVESNN